MPVGGLEWCDGGDGFGGPFTVVATCYRSSRNRGPNDIGSVGAVVSAQMLTGKSYYTCETIKDVNRTKWLETVRAIDLPYPSALLDCNFWLGAHIFLPKPLVLGRACWLCGLGVCE